MSEFKHQVQETWSTKQRELRAGLAILALGGSLLAYNAITGDDSEPDLPHRCPQGTTLSSTIHLFEDKNTSVEQVIRFYLPELSEEEAKSRMVVVNDEGTPTGKPIDQAGPGDIIDFNNENCDSEAYGHSSPEPTKTENLPIIEPQSLAPTATQTPQ